MQSQAELSALKQKQEQERKDGVLQNVATVLLEYDGTGSDQELVKALDQKYDALKDKLLLEALKKQLGMSSILYVVIDIYFPLKKKQEVKHLTYKNR